MGAFSGRLRFFGFLTFLIVCALALAAHIFYLFLADEQRFPVNAVKITTSYEHISRRQLERILVKYLHSSFFALPVSQLYDELMRLEWAGKVQIDRIWPDSLKINLIEKKPIATWNDGLLTQAGEVFNVGHTSKKTSLPHLSGPEHQQKEVLQVYKKLSKILSIYGLQAAINS